MLCTLLTIDQFEDTLNDEPYFFVYKYNSKSCSISDRTLQRLLEAQTNYHIPVYFVDIIQSRQLSNHISDRLQVRHESPQIISVQSGESCNAVSHMRITQDRLIDQYNHIRSGN